MHPVATLTRLDTQEQIPLARGVTTIGRRETNTVRLDAKGVSRGHCRIENRQGLWTLYDSGSATGTLVNGTKVSERQLDSGDTIQIGSVTLRFELPKPGTPPLPGARRLTNGAAKRLVPDKIVLRALGPWLRCRVRCIAVCLAAFAIGLGVMYVIHSRVPQSPEDVLGRAIQLLRDRNGTELWEFLPEHRRHELTPAALALQVDALPDSVIRALQTLRHERADRSPVTARFEVAFEWEGRPCRDAFVLERERGHWRLSKVPATLLPGLLP